MSSCRSTQAPANLNWPYVRGGYDAALRCFPVPSPSPEGERRTGPRCPPYSSKGIHVLGCAALNTSQTDRGITFTDILMNIDKGVVIQNS